MAERARLIAPVIGVPADDARSERRREDARFLTGEGRYLDDAGAAGELAAVFVRSPHAHAAIVSVDTAAARAWSGVRAVLTVADLDADGIGDLPCSVVLPAEAGLVVPQRPALARGVARYVGEAVACVIADTPLAARDAAEQVRVEYRTLPATIDLAASVLPTAPQIWPTAPENIAYRFRRGDASAVQAAIASAAHVVEIELVNNRIAAAALEPRAAIGRYETASGIWRLAISGASVHAIRQELAESVLRVPPERVHVSCPDVGGGFGMKNVLYPEHVVVLAAARRLGRPVRWIAERIEEFSSGVHARDNLSRGKLALDARGRFLALQVETLANLGAALSSLGPGSSTSSPATAMGGLYDIPAISMDVRGVFTNTVPVDAYRGAGKPEANFIIERLIDLAATKLGFDPIVLRRANLIARTPHRTALGMLIDSGDFRGNLHRALAAADRDGFKARRRASTRAGRLRGFGVACFLETSRGRPGEEAWLTVLSDGSISLAVGTQSNGQGHETSFPQVAAEQLGLPAGAFRLVQGDTALVPRGGGHGGARSLHMGGAAIVLAARDLLARALPVAARMLQARPEAIIYRAGAFRHGETGAAVDIFAVARSFAEEGSGTLCGHGDNRSDVFTFPNGCQVAEVEVDPETGAVALLSYVAIDDYGRLVNPLLTESQVQGGLAQGIGQALLEEIRYEASSGQLQTATFMDYCVPRASDLPFFDIRFVECGTAVNPLGAKGAGQAGAIGAPQTVVNAVLDALRPLGVTHLDMPLTPEAVWRAIRAAKPAIAPPYQSVARARSGHSRS